MVIWTKSWADGEYSRNFDDENRVENTWKVSKYHRVSIHKFFYHWDVDEGYLRLFIIIEII